MSRYFSKLAQKSGKRWLTGTKPISSGSIETTHVAKPAEVSGGFSGRLREVHQEVIVEKCGQPVAGVHTAGYSFAPAEPKPMAVKPDGSVSPPGRETALVTDQADRVDAAGGLVAANGAEGAVGNKNKYVSGHVDKQARAAVNEQTPAMEQVTVRESGRPNPLGPKRVMAAGSEQRHGDRDSDLETAVAAGDVLDNPDTPISAPVVTAAETRHRRQDRQAGSRNQDVNDAAPDKSPESRNNRIHEQASSIVVENKGDHTASSVFEPQVDNGASFAEKTGNENSVSIRIGLIQLEVHQAVEPSKPVTPLPPTPTPVPQRPGGNSQQPAKTRLNRYYLRLP